MYVPNPHRKQAKTGGTSPLHTLFKRGQLSEYNVDPSNKHRVRRLDVYRLRHVENRATIVHMKTVDGKSIKEIAEELHLSQKKVEWYLEWALQRTLQTPSDERIMPKLRNPRSNISSTTPAAVSAVAVVPTQPSEDPEIQVSAFRLRTNMVPIDEIAKALAITPQEAAKAIRIHADALNKSEISETEIARRIQVEQIDQAIRYLMPMVVGFDQSGPRPKGVVLEAIDRFVKLLDAKAKLLGLNSPVRIDMEIRLQKIAESGEYDFETLKAIFEEVVQEYPQLTAGI